MIETLRKISVISIAAAMTCTALAACSNGTEQNSNNENASPATTTGSVKYSLDENVRSDIEKAFSEANENRCDNATFSGKTTTTVTDNGKTATAKATKDGEIEYGENGVRLHFDYVMNVGQAKNETEYEMFVDGDNAYVKQDGVLYGGVEGAEPSDYVSAITDLTSPEVLNALLDAARGYNIETDGDDTVVTIKANANKLSDTNLIDKSSLPANTVLSTLEARYVIGPDKRFKSVSLETETAKTPLYRIEQTCEFSKYNETTLPEFPTTADLASQNLNIETDADGRQYVIAEDGNKYYVDSVEEDESVRLVAEG